MFAANITHEDDPRGGHLYYVEVQHCSQTFPLIQYRVDANIFLAPDGTLAAISLIDHINMPPPPPPGATRSVHMDYNDAAADDTDVKDLVALCKTLLMALDSATERMEATTKRCREQLSEIERRVAVDE